MTDPFFNGIAIHYNKKMMTQLFIASAKLAENCMSLNDGKPPVNFLLKWSTDSHVDGEKIPIIKDIRHPIFSMSSM